MVSNHLADGIALTTDGYRHPIRWPVRYNAYACVMAADVPLIAIMSISFMAATGSGTGTYTFSAATSAPAPTWRCGGDGVPVAFRAAWQGHQFQTSPFNSGFGMHSDQSPACSSARCLSRKYCFTSAPLNPILSSPSLTFSSVPRLRS